ncbi:MAG: hypothetical protein ACI8S6_004294 [Myxococcota bacterium]|jgi:hypothetical protein
MIFHLLFLACTRSDDMLSDTGEPACGSWASVGQPLVLSQCAGCHSSRLSGSDRQGAPAGVDLETLDGVRSHTDRVLARAVEAQDMPVGGLGEAERERLERWLGCGAPGEAAPLPAMEAADDAIAAGDISVSVSPGTGSDTRIVARTLDGGDVLLETFLVEDDLVRFSGYALTGESGRSRMVRFSEPIPLYVDGEAAAFSAEVELNIDGALTVQVWSVEGADLTVDGRSEDRAPVAVVVTSEEGEEHQWFLSDSHIISGRRLWVDGLSAEFLRLDAFVPGLPDEPTPFPPEAGDLWSESVVWGEVVPWWD